MITVTLSIPHYEIIIVLFIMQTMKLFLMFWCATDTEYGFSLHLVVEWVYLTLIHPEKKTMKRKMIKKGKKKKKMTEEKRKKKNK